MQILGTDTRTGFHDYCARPADQTNRCVLHRSHAARAQQELQVEMTECQRCGASVVDDGSFYECGMCGDTDLVRAAVV
jgi:ribosomal protein S27AE